MIFPTVKGSNLLRQKIILPKDFSMDFNLLFVPFQQWQQKEVDSWIPVAQQMEDELAGFTYYELPTIHRMNPISRTFINEGMRMGIPDKDIRKRTITLYLDKQSFKQTLDMPDEDHIYVLLSDRYGNIHWRARGPYSSELEEPLQKAILALQEKHQPS